MAGAARGCSAAPGSMRTSGTSTTASSIAIAGARSAGWFANTRRGPDSCCCVADRRDDSQHSSACTDNHERGKLAWSMLTFSTDPNVAEQQMNAIIFYLTAFGYIDG